MSTSQSLQITGLSGPESNAAAVPVPWLLATNGWAWASLTVVAAAAVAAVALNQPLVALLVLVAVPLVLVTAVWPNAPTPLVIFILYSNAAVVAVRFHGIPGPAAALVPAVLAIPLVHYILLNRQPIVLTGTLPWALLFMVIQMLGVLVSKHPQEAWGNVQAMMLEGVGLYVIITNVVRSRATIQSAIWALLLAGSLMGGLSVFQQVTRSFDNNYGGFAQVPGRGFRVAERGVEHRQARLCGPIGEQNRYAQVTLMLVPLGLFHFLSEPTAKGRALAAVATALSAAGCVLAFSRGTAIAFVLMLVLMALIGQLRLRHLMFLMLGAVLLLMAAPQYRTRLASIQTLVDVTVTGHTAEGELDGATRGRLTVMLAAARVAADHPLLGVGPGMFNYYSREYGNDGGMRALEGTREAHSLYLEIAAEHGLPGLACFLIMVSVSLYHLMRTRLNWQTADPQLSNWASGFMLAIASYLATGIFLHFSYARYFWLILALADATSHLGRRATTHRIEQATSKSIRRSPTPTSSNGALGSAPQ